MILSYKENAQHFAQFLAALTPKKIFSFKSAKIPPSLAEKNIGLILMTLIAAFVDPAIRLNNDKSSLFDKSWTASVLPYFQNCGKVIQNIKKIKDSLDYHAGNQSNNWNIVLSPAMQRDIFKMYDEI